MIAFPNAILQLKTIAIGLYGTAYLNYSKLMYAVAMKRLSNPQDAEDAVHEAILRLMKNISFKAKTVTFCVATSSLLLIGFHRSSN